MGGFNITSLQRNRGPVQARSRAEDGRAVLKYIDVDDLVPSEDNFYSMSAIDELAGLIGIRYAQRDVITASVDNLKFIRGAYLKDLIVLIGRVTYVGRTSMEVRVDTYIESIDGIRKPINRAYLTLVAIDDDGKPVEVPRLIVETEAEKAEWEAGIKRRKMRRQRQEEGF